MDKKTIIFSAIGVILLIWMIKKLSPGESQTITQVVPVGSVPNTSNTDAHLAYDQNKTTAFLGLLDLGKSQLASQVQSKNIDTQIPLETIRAGVANTQTEAQKEIGLASFDRDLQLGNLSSKTAIQLAQLQTDSQLAQTQAATQSAERLLQAQLDARAAELSQASNAINSASITYRNQSLERQGTILNALTTLYTGQAPYTYQGAFGGARPPSVLQQLFPSGIGGIVDSLFGWL